MNYIINDFLSKYIRYHFSFPNEFNYLTRYNMGFSRIYDQGPKVLKACGPRLHPPYCCIRNYDPRYRYAYDKCSRFVKIPPGHPYLRKIDNFYEAYGQYPTFTFGPVVME
jgi:hypothetical protein